MTEKGMHRSESLSGLDRFWKQTGGGKELNNPFARSPRIQRSPPGPVENEQEREEKKRKLMENQGERRDGEDSIMSKLAEILREMRGNKKDMDESVREISEKIDKERQERLKEKEDQEKQRERERQERLKERKDEEEQRLKEKMELEKWKEEMERKFKKMEEWWKEEEGQMEGLSQEMDESDRERMEEGEGYAKPINEWKHQRNKRKERTERKEGKGETGELLKKIEELQSDRRRDKERMEELENRSRRCNVVFSGLEDNGRETITEIEKKVEEVLSKRMEVEGVRFVRLHRVGVYVEGRNRVVVGKLKDEDDKKRIFGNRVKLRETKIYVDDDFGVRTRVARSKLRFFGREKQKNGEGKFRLVVDVLQVGEREYVYDDVQGKVVEREKKGSWREKWR